MAEINAQRPTPNLQHATRNDVRRSSAFICVHLRFLLVSHPTILSIPVLVFLSGCGGSLPHLPADATILVWRVPAGHGIGANTELVTADPRQHREMFVRLYDRTRRVGTCDPLLLQRDEKARPFAIVQYTHPLSAPVELNLLQTADGRALAVGHGAFDVFAPGLSTPEYRYRLADVQAVMDWLAVQPRTAPKPPPPATQPAPDFRRIPPWLLPQKPGP
jgi:hypothetical protein